MRIVALVLALAAVLAAPASTATTPKSGLYGKVTRGPLTPVCRVGTPCVGPAQVTLVFTRTGAAPVRTRSSVKGLYRVALRPGLYSVTTQTTVGMGRRPVPLKARVQANRFLRVDFTIDTGIR